MFNANDLRLGFKTTAEVEAFTSWYLGTTVSQVKDEFEGDDQQWLEFITRRERRLKVQLDDLMHLSFTSAITCPINKISYFKIVKEAYKDTPLSSAYVCLVV